MSEAAATPAPGLDALDERPLSSSQRYAAVLVAWASSSTATT